MYGRGMGLRLTLALRLLGSLVFSLVGLSLLAGSLGEAEEGIWAVKLLGLASLPLVAVGVATAFVFPRSIRARPTLWAGGAVLLCMAAGFATAAVAGLVFAALIAVPAFLLFVGSVKVWPGYADLTTDSAKVR